MITENAQQIIKTLIARFESGDIAPLVDIATLKLTTKNAPIPAARWSMCNQLLAYIQTGQIECRGFRQWQQVNRFVVKGAHAAYILGPVTIKDKKKAHRWWCVIPTAGEGTQRVIVTVIVHRKRSINGKRRTPLLGSSPI